MKYFKNTELAKFYNVSEKSIRNWIEAAKNGKLDLQLVTQDNKLRIANTSKNTFLIEQLAIKGKKFKNTRSYKVVSPIPNFYKFFNSKEILDITSNLDTYHEMPLQYSYFDGGAAIWSAYVQRLAEENTPNILTNTIELLDGDAIYIDSLLEGGDSINIIDIGPGNCYPVRTLLERFTQAERLNRYITIDASREMLNIAENNIKEWFGNKIKFESYSRDITYERFGDLLSVDSFGKEKSVRNVVLFLGSTLSNFRDSSQPLSAIRESMGKNDLLIFSRQLDTPHARRYFDYNTESDNIPKLTPKSQFILSLLNIDESLYDVEYSFDETNMARRLQVRLKVALSLEFQLNGRQKIINFNKDETILLWRHKHQNVLQTIEHFDTNGFELLQANVSKDHESLLAIMKIKTPLEQ